MPGRRISENEPQPASARGHRPHADSGAIQRELHHAFGRFRILVAGEGRNLDRSRRRVLDEPRHDSVTLVDWKPAEALERLRHVALRVTQSNRAAFAALVHPERDVADGQFLVLLRAVRAELDWRGDWLPLQRHGRAALRLETDSRFLVREVAD